MASTNSYTVLLKSRKFVSILLVLLLVDLAAPAPAHNSALYSRLNDPCTHNRTRHVRNIHSRNATCNLLAVVRNTKQNLSGIYNKPRVSSVKVTIPLLSGKVKKMKKMDKWEKKLHIYVQLRTYVEAIDYMARQKVSDEKIEKKRKDQWHRVGSFATSLQCELYTELRRANVTLPEPVSPTGTSALKKAFNVPKEISYLHEQDYRTLDKFNKFVTSTKNGARKCPRGNRKSKESNKRKKTKVPKTKKNSPPS